MELELRESQIKSIQLQLQVLKAKTQNTTHTKHTFASLYGVLKGVVESTIEDIEIFEYQVKWNGSE